MIGARRDDAVPLLQVGADIDHIQFVRVHAQKTGHAVRVEEHFGAGRRAVNQRNPPSDPKERLPFTEIIRPGSCSRYQFDLDPLICDPERLAV